MTSRFSQWRRVRRAERAIRQMSYLERDIFFAVRHDTASYEQLATQHGVSVSDVQNAFANALYRLTVAMHPRWWQIWLW